MRQKENINLMDLSFTLTDTCRIAGVMFLAVSLALSGMTNSLRFTLLHGVSGSFSGTFFFFLVMCGCMCIKNGFTVNLFFKDVTVYYLFDIPQWL